MTSQDVDDLDAVLFTAAGGNRLAQDDLLLAIVHRRIELKLGNPVGVVDRPAGERARDGDDVGLRVAAVDAERVQLHQLAAVVLVEPRTPRVGRETSARDLLARRLRLPVVEVEQHRRVASRGQQQVAEPAEDVRTDRIALVAREQHAPLSLAVEHVEVIQPEIDEHFLELAVRVERAIHPAVDQLLIHEHAAAAAPPAPRAAVRECRRRPPAGACGAPASASRRRTT